MSDAFEQQEWMKFGIAATLSKQYAADQRMFLDLLAQMLERALPEETEIGKKGGFFSKKTIQHVAVVMDNTRYMLEDPGRGPLVATRAQMVRGICLKTEQIRVEDWLAELGAALDERAKTSQAAREAMAKMIG